MLDVKGKPKFKKRFLNYVPSDFSRNLNDRGSNRGGKVDPPRETPTCGKCGKKNGGEHLVGTNICYGCGKGVHMVKVCPNVKSQGKGNSQAQPSGPNSEAPKRNQFYALKSRCNVPENHMSNEE